MIGTLPAKLGVAVFSCLIAAEPLYACTVCFGQSDSRMAQGMNMGIFVLLAVIASVLCGVVGFFYHLARRGAEIEESAAQLKHLSQNTTNA